MATHTACKSIWIAPEVRNERLSPLIFVALEVMTNNLITEFASGGDATQNITWDHGSTSGVEYHTFQLATQQEFVELDNQAGWGQWFISTADEDGVR